MSSLPSYTLYIFKFKFMFTYFHISCKKSLYSCLMNIVHVQIHVGVQVYLHSGKPYVFNTVPKSGFPRLHIHVINQIFLSLISTVAPRKVYVHVHALVRFHFHISCKTLTCSSLCSSSPRQTYSFQCSPLPGFMKLLSKSCLQNCRCLGSTYPKWAIHTCQNTPQH